MSGVDPEGLASRFGVHVGPCPGTGMEALPAFEAALAGLLDDPERRASLGAQGRAWVEAAHTRARFLQSFLRIVELAGAGRPPSRDTGRWPAGA